MRDRARLWRRGGARVLARAALACALAPGPARAQTAPDPAPDRSFATLEPSLGRVQGLSGWEGPEGWGAPRGWSLRLATPYLGGRLHARAERTRQEPFGGAPGELGELWTALGWERSVLSAGPIAVTLSGELGAVRFDLPRPINPAETEVAAALAIGLRARAPGGLSVIAELGRRWTFTEPGLRRDALSLSVGRPVGWRGLRRLLDGPVEPASPPGAALAVDSVPATVTSREVRGGPPLPRPARLAERVAALPGVEAATADGLALTLAGPGSPAFSPLPWAVRVDGVEIATATPGALALDRIPVDPGAVASVALASGPGLTPGRAGVIDVRLRSLAPGWSAAAWGRGDNATGDPGPHSLLERGGYNVESLEWGVGGEAGWRGARGSVRAHATRHRRWVTQFPEFRRTFLAVDPDLRWPFLDVAKVRLSATVDGGGWRHEATFARSTLEDFLLVPGAAREVPALSTLEQLHGGGRRPLGGGELRWSLDGRRDGVESGPNTLGRDFSWRAEEVAARVGWRGRRAELGIELARAAVRATPSPRDRRDGRIRVDGSVALGRAVRIDGGLLRTDGELGGSAAGRVSGSAGGVAWGVRAGVERAPRALAPVLWRHGAADPAFLGPWGLGGARLDAPAPAARAGVLAWVRKTDGAGWGELSAGVERSAGVLVPVPSIALAGEVPAASGPLEVLEGSGTAAVLLARWGWERAPLAIEGSWTARTLFAGDRGMRAAHATLPRHRLRQQLGWIPRSDLELTVALDARSRTRWSGYLDNADAGLPEGSETVVRPELRGGVRVDVAVTKALWEGRAHAALTVRDALDRAEPLHPLGAAPGLTLVVSGTVRAGGLPR